MQDNKKFAIVAGLVVAIVVAGFFLIRSRDNTPDTTATTGPTIPAEVQQEFQRRGVSAPGQSKSAMPTAPMGR